MSVSWFKAFQPITDINVGIHGRLWQKMADEKPEEIAALVDDIAPEDAVILVEVDSLTQESHGRKVYTLALLLATRHPVLRHAVLQSRLCNTQTPTPQQKKVIHDLMLEAIRLRDIELWEHFIHTPWIKAAIEKVKNQGGALAGWMEALQKRTLEGLPYEAPFALKLMDDGVLPRTLVGALASSGQEEAIKAIIQKIGHGPIIDKKPKKANKYAASRAFSNGYIELAITLYEQAKASSKEDDAQAIIEEWVNITAKGVDAMWRLSGSSKILGQQLLDTREVWQTRVQKGIHHVMKDVSEKRRDTLRAHLFTLASKGVLDDLWQPGNPEKLEPREAAALLIGPALPGSTDYLRTFLQKHHPWKRNEDNQPGIFESKLLDKAKNTRFNDTDNEIQGLWKPFALMRKEGLIDEIIFDSLSQSLTGESRSHLMKQICETQLENRSPSIKKKRL